ncbi:hypothetical protein QSH82_24535, partial [Escherichia coli]|uniref:hypothetical protein n=1 Tax=Escherichia coli TaxID=562 RepID=UPI00256EF983
DGASHPRWTSTFQTYVNSLVFRQHGKFADYLRGHTVKVGISRARACLGIFTREGQQLLDEMDRAIHPILQFAQQVLIAQFRVVPS